VGAVVTTLAGASVSPAAIPGVPAIYVNYNQNCTFTVSADGGITISQSAVVTLPPGAYQLLVSMPNPSSGYSCVTPNFSMTGPGVNIQIVFPAQSIDVDQATTLEPSSTYVVQDANAPSATQMTFATAASGSSASLLPSQPTTTLPASGGTQPDLVGSASSAASTSAHAVLAATVSTAGRATLESKARSVASLTAGRYEITVDDASAHAGFSLRHGDGKPIALTGVAFVGKRTTTVTLTAGRWSFYAGAGDPKSFTVRS
jgi:hypothetical protein